MSIGGNNPPGPIETAAQAAADISAWMTEHPAVTDELDAREFKLYLDRGKNAIGDLEKARDAEVRPLNTKVKTINAEFRVATNALERLVGALEERLATFIREEAFRRHVAAAEAKKKMEEAEDRAYEAEAKERESIENAKAGELVDVGLTIREADAAFNAYQRAEREAQRADRETHVKISGGFKNAISLRTKETLVVTDGLAAIQSMGISERMIAAILSDAREFRKRYGRLPAGIRVVEEETL